MGYPDYKAIVFDCKDSVCHITLNNPDNANSINVEVAKELSAALLLCDENPDVRVALITSSGGMFCSGGDLKSFSRQGEQLPRYLKETTMYFHSAISRLVRMDVPTVAAIKGNVAGAGVGLACACDIVLVAESVRFSMAYTRVGLTPDGGTTYFLTRNVGLRRSLELILLNRSLSAQEAVECGIATRVVSDNSLFEEAETTARQLASGATRAFGAAKRLLHSAGTETLETQMALESRFIAESSITSDAREGIAAFIEKRQARFRGR
jgi:2-(1,2-epoxy-1,2-dihydrophenyl)acetyl-CoA isomerase